MKSIKKPTEVATDDPLLVNNYGQDIEFRIAPDAKSWGGEWNRLPKGDRMPVAAPPQACTLEIRITLRQPIDGPLATIEVTRNLQVKCKQRGEPTQPKAPPQKSGPTKPAGKRASRTKRLEKPSDSRGRAAG